MRATLLALNEELIRLKAAGIEDVSISDESIALLRKLAGASKTVAESSMDVAPSPSAKSGPVAPPSFGENAAAKKPATPTPTPNLPEAPKVDLPDGDKQARWDALLAQIKADPVCERELRPGKKVVLGVGDLEASIFFCGEAPGAEEETQGEPFVGPAGQLLTKMIGGMGLKREDVYIGNIMNWRPQLPTEEGHEQVGNRPPTAAEMTYCLPYLRAQLEVVRPKVIVALGATAAKGLLGFDRFKALGEVRGKWHEFSGVPVMVTYHPSYILRNQSNRSKRVIWEDLLQVMERVELPISEKQRGYFSSR
jgi:uracil-DNA glycosylase